MKTLKYLVLLMAVALALPAMAQGKKVDGATQGKLSKNVTYTVEVIKEGQEAHFLAGNDKWSLEVVKLMDGRVEKNCYRLKAVCPPGYKFIEEDEPQLAPNIIDDKVFPIEENLRDVRRVEEIGNVRVAAQEMVMR